jgi:hypothetical protein
VVQVAEAKARLAHHAMDKNQPKITGARSA